jgi:hypothetical protein
MNTFRLEPHHADAIDRIAKARGREPADIGAAMVIDIGPGASDGEKTAWLWDAQIRCGIERRPPRRAERSADEWIAIEAAYRDSEAAIDTTEIDR